MKRAYGRLLVKVQPSCSKGLQRSEYASPEGWSPRRAAAVGWSLPELRRQAVCAAEVNREVSQTPRGHFLNERLIGRASSLWVVPPMGWWYWDL